MSILRSYIDKNNTISSNSFVNTGRNPIVELNFGASDFIVPNYGYTRYLFDLDLTDLVTNIQTGVISTGCTTGMTHVLKMTNTSSFDNELLNNNLKMMADVAGILNFDLNKNKIRFFVEWINYPPKNQIEKYSDLQIESDKIYWENNPNIFDPFGKNIDVEI